MYLLTGLSMAGVATLLAWQVTRRGLWRRYIALWLVGCLVTGVLSKQKHLIEGLDAADNLIIRLVICLPFFAGLLLGGYLGGAEAREGP